MDANERECKPSFYRSVGVCPCFFVADFISYAFDVQH